MTDPAPRLTVVAPPPQDWVNSITRRPQPLSERIDWEQRTHDAEARIADAETRATDAETRATDAETRATDAETRATDAETRATDAETRAEGGDQRVATLLRALDSRGPIDQAKGILMSAFGLDADAAFDTLVWISQSSNVKLAHVVDRFLFEMRVVDAGEHNRERLTSLLAAIGRPNGEHFR